MKSITYFIKKFTNRVLLVLIPVICLTIIGCYNEIDEWEIKSENQVIAEFVASEANKEKYSEFAEILEYTGIKNLLRVRGPYTLLLPNNEAIKNFYEEKNVNSYLDFDSTYLKDLVYNHLFPALISSGNIGFGALISKNAIGDYITSEFSGAEIILNKYSKIVKRDIETSNGYIHEIDKVIDIVTDDIFETLKNTPGYSIFTAGIEKCKMQDTLKIISFSYGKTTIRNYYTIFAVPDTLYERNNINNIDDLIAEYATGDDLTDPDNGFFKYMEFHILSNTYYLSFFEGKKVYPIFTSNAFINVDVRKEYKINAVADTFTTFYLELCNIPAKNGAIHTINTLMPATEVEPAKVIFETTDFFDFKQLPCYGKYYDRFYDGENTFEDLKWNADYLMYYYKEGQHLLNDDGLSASGHFWIQLTTPKIMKGKYMLASHWFGSGTGNNASFSWTIDSVELEHVSLINDSGWGGPVSDISELEFTETKSHTIKITTIVPLTIWWDRLEFTPVN